MPSFIVYLSTFAILLSLLIHIFQYKTQTSNTSLSDIPLAQILTFHTSNTSNLQNSPKNNKIAFGYASDLDIVVNALELIYSLNLNQSVLPNPFHHQSLTNKSQFIETLAYFFQKGSGVEFYLENQKDFEEIITKSLPLAKIKDLGGNGAVMALRGYQEGINVLLGCNIDKKSYLELFDSKIELVSEITDIMTDIHLVLDFTEGEQWGPLVCPRSNRFYVNHDVLNTELKLLDVFHERIKEFRPDIVSVGGLHLFNDFEETKIKEVFERVGRKLAQDKEISKIHVEMGSFTNEFIVHSLVGSVFPHVHSLGLNEQELSFLIDYFEKGNMFYGSNSRTTMDKLLGNLVLLIKYIKENGMPMERIQFHSLNLHSICYKKQFWENPQIALQKSVLVALQTCKYEGSHIPLDDFEFDVLQMEGSIPSEIELKTLDYITKNQEIDPKNPFGCWDIDSEWNCCYVMSPNWISPKRTRGLGDNISSTGLIYHKIRN